MLRVQIDEHGFVSDLTVHYPGWTGRPQHPVGSGTRQTLQAAVADVLSPSAPPAEQRPV